MSKDFKKQLAELQAMIKDYFDDSSQLPYNVDGFINQDVAVYKRYEVIQDKFEMIAVLFDKEKKDNSVHGTSGKSEEYLKLVNLCLSRKIKC